MLQDLHNHTYFSYDGCDSPEAFVESAISNGIKTLGICDHQFTDGFRLDEYVSKLRSVKNHYKNQCDVKIGLEIGTRPRPNNLIASRASQLLDYCLFESLDSERAMDLYEFIEWRRLFSCPVGLAHTDIFAMSKRYGIDMLSLMYENDVFWEINTSGNYVYYYDFISNTEKQTAVKNSGITLSIGSDTHRVGSLSAAKLASANELADFLGNRIIFGKRW